MKKILSSISILTLLMFGSISVYAEDPHLQEAITQTKAATQADDSEAIAQHVLEAERNAVQAKSTFPGNKNLEEGLKSLSDAIDEARADKIDEAKKSATNALNNLEKIEKK